MSNIPVGLQMHTVRQEFMEDMPGTLKRVAEMGYAGCEMAPLEDVSPVELKQMIADAGLKLISSHVSFVKARDDFQAVADFHHALGNTNLVLGAIPGDLRETNDGWKLGVEQTRRIGGAAKAAGFRLHMHNHAFELTDSVDGIEAHHYIFSTVPAELLNTQLDTFFIKDVGKAPAAYVRKFAGRCPLLHIKDKAKPDTPDSQTQIGNGTIDWDAVFAAAEESGVEWYIVEQRKESAPGIESAKISIDYLKSRGMA